MKKMYFLLLPIILMTGHLAISQCTNSSQFGTITAPTNNLPVTITTCAFGGEFSTINGAIAGSTYQFSATGGTGNFLTIRQGTPGGTVLGFGTSPITVTCTVSGPLYLHYNTNAACGTDGSCHVGTVQCTSCPPVVVPVNDLCSGAININCAQTVTGSTVAATVDVVPFCVTPLSTAKGVWYTFTGNGAAATLSLCGSGYDTKIGVFTGTCGSFVCVTGNDDFCGLQSQVNFPTVFGTQYYILITGFGAESGSFTLTRTCIFPNEVCSGAININCGQTINGTTTGAAIDAVATCGTALNTAPGIWYSFTGDGSPVTLATCGGITNYDSKIGVFTGTCASLVCVAGNDDFCGFQSQVTFATTFGTPYYILVTGFSTGTGNFSLTRTCVPICAGTPSPGTISGPATACVGATGTLTLSGFTLLPGISVQWKSATVSGGPYTNISGAINSTYNFTATGITTYYIATVTCSNGGASANTPQFTLTQGAPIHSAVSFIVTNSCTPGIVTVTGTAINGGPGNYTHTLTGPGTITPNASTGPNNSTGNFTVSNLPAGTHSFVLASVDGIGCTTSSIISGVIINQTPIITFTPAAPVICNGAIQQITANVVPPTLQTFSQPATTIIPAGAPPVTSGIADPYPSQITIAGLPTTGVTVKSVKLGNVNHTFPDDIDIVLVSPAGQSVILMSDVGGGPDVVGLDYTLDDAAATAMADAALNPQGTYKPTNFNTPDNFVAPGPGSLTQATPTLASFTGNPNGDWKLYVVDDLGGDVGFIGNWNITFNLTSLVVFSPTTNLFTNALATIPYTGTPTSVVFARPTATTTYTAISTVSGCTGTGTVTVTVNNLPAITVQPTPATQTICPGFNVSYSVTATGTGLTYQWRRNGVALTDNAQISGSATNTITITGVTSANTGNYDVVVSGVCPPPVISNTVVLNVATAPVISAQPANTTVCVGANATFTVATAGSIPPPTIFQWQVSTTGPAGPWINLTSGGSFTPTFTITGVTTAMNGNLYRVIVTNSCGQTTTSANALLTVNPLPVVTIAALPSRICISDTLVPLSGSPVGGSFSGIGVSGFNFVPSTTAVGTYTLTYTYTNPLGCTGTATVIAKVEDCQERLRLLRDDAVILYPNPNNGRFNIRINSTLYNYLGMKVYNMQGQLMNGVIKDNILNSPVYTGLVYGRVIPIDLTHLPAGVYLVKFYYDDGIRTSEKGFKVVIAGH